MLSFVLFRTFRDVSANQAARLADWADLFGFETDYVDNQIRIFVVAEVDESPRMGERFGNCYY
jgi:hypothetical protein